MKKTQIAILAGLGVIALCVFVGLGSTMVLMFIGDDEDAINGPNSSPLDRFVYMAFYKGDGGTTGTMDLVARQPGDGPNGGEFTKISTGLNLDQWYTIRVEVNPVSGTYDIYVNGNLEGQDIQAWASKASLTHISFATLSSESLDKLLSVVPGDLLHRVVHPFESGRIAPHDRLPLSLGHLVFSDVEAVHADDVHRPRVVLSDVGAHLEAAPLHPY